MTKTDNTNRPLRWFDYWRCAEGDALQAIVRDVTAALDRHEASNGLRKRQRKAADAAAHRTMIDGVVANLAHAVLLPPEDGGVALLTGKGHGVTRYDRRAFGKTFSRLLWRMEEVGALTHAMSRQRGVASSVTPTPAFAEAVRSRGVTLDHIGRASGEETIRLTHRRKVGGPESRRIERVAVDYRDTAQTVALRAEMARVNDHLAVADIAFVDDGLGPVDARQRFLRRRFLMLETDDAGVPRFDRSGRLFGGFWMNLARARRQAIRIGGEPVATLDYASMFPRLAYAKVGRQPPDGDLYAIRGLEGKR